MFQRCISERTPTIDKWTKRTHTHTDSTYTSLSKPAIFSAQTSGSGGVPELPQDTDSFSEIDLTATSESQTPSRPQPVEYNPLQDLEESEGRGLGVLDGADDTASSAASTYLQQTSALTAQFAAQLPNVASTVFSTFSRVIKGNSPAPPTANEHQQQPSASYSQHEFLNTPHHTYGGPPLPLPSAGSLTPLLNSSAFDPSAPLSTLVGADQQHLEQGQSAAAQSLPPAPPPTFYNPEQLPSTAPPPSASGAPVNSYRLGGSKKKTYAHIPGLSTSASQPIGEVIPGAPSPQNAPFVPHPFAPPVLPQPADAPTNQGAAFPHPADTTNLFPVAQPLDVGRVEPPPPAAADTKGKPSLFGYIPTKIFDKLPKPSFGGEAKKEEVTLFAAPQGGASIVDQFAELSVTSGLPPQGVAVAATPFAGGPPSAAQSQPPVSSSHFSPDVPEATEQPIAPGPVQPPSQPPPKFYSPGQFPAVSVAPPSATARKGNPYSAARRAPGVGRYKNPLAPVSAPTTGPIFLPNQLPPTAAQSQQLKEHPAVVVGAGVTQVFSTVPPSILTTTQQAPVSIFNPAVSTTDTSSILAPDSTSVGEPIPQQSAASHPEPLEPSLVPTFAGSFPPAGLNKQPFSQPPVSIFNPAASVQGDQAVSGVGVEPSFPYTPASQNESVFPLPPVVEPLEIANVEPPTTLSKLQESFAPLESQNEGVPPLSQQASFVEPPESANNPWQAQFNSFNIPSGSSVSQANSSTVPARLDFPQSDGTGGGFTQFLDADAPSGGSKPIIDSRSRSSENVLSPPPRPNSNLSEPAVIFPAFVPPADIFRSHTDPSAPALAADIFQQLGASQQQANESHYRPTAQDTNGNNPADFFSGSLTPSLASNLPAKQQVEASQTSESFFVPSAQQELTASYKTPESAPAINPTDFFNSNSIVADSSIKTGQAVSSVPLFNFFGRATETSVVDSGTGNSTLTQEPKGHHGGEELANEQPAAVPPSKSNVSSFDNVNNRSELAAAEDDDGGQEGTARIGNASNEPIFSSDNLFEFKSSAYQDGGFYSRNAGQHGLDAHDGNSSMAAMATTSVGAPDTTGTSIAESGSTNIAYRPTYNHWFYRREVEGKVMWSPFTMADSMALEDGWVLANGKPRTAADDEEGSEPPAPVIVHTDGGRYDVSIRERQRTPVYWNGPSNEVRRCSWFYKNVDSRFVPYEEEVAEQLEREYKEASTSGEWHRRVTIPNGETVVFHGPSVIVHFLQTQNPDTWGGGSSPVPSTTNRPRVVKRGIDEFNIDDDEPEKIDHLLFMVHGIGEACDLRFRRVEEVVEEFRSISAQLVQSHYRSSFDRGDVGRVEILPISWHDDLHSVESGVDEKLKSITLDSIPKLRHFTNDTLLDVLFYTSPMFCQSIIDAVGNSLNRLYTLFCQRNPSFNGRISLAGHSLGSLILFDLLCHQKKAEPNPTMEQENSENPDGDSVPPLPHHHAHVHHRPLVRKCSQQIHYEVGPAGTGQPYITYPQLLFEPKMFFALGSPIGMFVTIRGIDALGLDFKLPTCDGFFNIFHPYDPVAYRIEALINPELSALRPVLIPHHKGRKRMHLELKETMVRVSNDLKQRVSDVFRNTLDTVWALTTMSSRPDPKAIQQEVDKVLEDQLKFDTGASSTNLGGGSDVDSGETSLPLGRLNQTRRVDYVLQEAPFEFINEYLFALTSHVCYWDSEDTMLFVMKEIYSSLGVQTDLQVPQQSMTIERPLAGTSPAASSCSLNSNFNLFPQANNR
uniref:DDHD domain-containing protein n=1 Tax=Anopheles atroparvus TaxID=41427 RepID=A0AAG5CY66_ANOAO